MRFCHLSHMRKVFLNMHALLSSETRGLGPCADPESFARGGPTLTTVFLVDNGREDPNTNISGR